MTLEPNVGYLKNGEQRLLDREDCILRLNHKDEPQKTHTDVVQKRKTDMINDNTNKFGE